MNFISLLCEVDLEITTYENKKPTKISTEPCSCAQVVSHSKQLCARAVMSSKKKTDSRTTSFASIRSIRDCISYTHNKYIELNIQYIEHIEVPTRLFNMFDSRIRRAASVTSISNIKNSTQNIKYQRLKLKNKSRNDCSL